MSEKKEKCVKIDIKHWLYKKMCVGCEREKICHDDCDCCDEFAKNLFCLEQGYECDYTYDFELEKELNGGGE